MSADRGFVSIVGAGPGDPELLTARAIDRLRRADLVLYDALVDARALAHAAGAQRFSVGKRAGRPSMNQAAINRLMIRAARRGRRIVRLKGGDPFVFGRGGEEAAALQAAAVAFEIVPGISAAVAAPALGGIPVTDRRLAHGFLVASGHDVVAFAGFIRGVAPNRLTLVVLMGVGHRAEIASALVESGWRGDTPAAVIAGASTPGQTVWRGRLREVGDAAIEANAAGTIVVGAVAALDLSGRGDAANALLEEGGVEYVSCR